MTKMEVLRQAYDLSVNGNFNHETGWSYAKFKAYVTEKTSIKKSLIMDIELPDGWWKMEIINLSDGLWDYYIPDTREEEKYLFRAEKLER